PPPPRVPVAAVPPEVAGMLTADRRIANRRLRDELGVALRYPSWQDALDDERRQQDRGPARPERAIARAAAATARLRRGHVGCRLGRTARRPGRAELLLHHRPQTAARVGLRRAGVTLERP